MDVTRRSWRAKTLIATVASIGASWLGAAAHGQAQVAPCRGTMPPTLPVVPDTAPIGRYGVPVNQACETGQFVSHCWFAHYAMNDGGNAEPQWTPGHQNEWNGFRLNVHLARSLGPGDYGPKFGQLSDRSYCLQSTRMPPSVNAAAFPSRPVLGNMVDIITGSRLIQETDLELPFGSAVFRHTRTLADPLTHSGNRRNPSLNSDYLYFMGEWPAGGPLERDLLWDWNGTGWMMGESPILLIDAASPASTASAVTAGTSPIDLHRVSYLIMDAHHKIPFKLAVSGTNAGTYEADRRHDAIMVQEGGVWNPSPNPADPDHPEGYWSSTPQRYVVWLAGGALKYTFGAVYFADVPHSFATREGGLAAPGSVVSTHGVPRSYQTQAGPASQVSGYQGTPYYAVLTQIDDRYGNRIKFYHCQQRQFTMDDPNTTNCRECGQNCNEKGQVTKAELISGADTPSQRIDWTLVYVYRGFTVSPPPPPGRQGPPDPIMGRWVKNRLQSQAETPHQRADLPVERQRQELLQQHALHAVYAYPGTLSIMQECLTLSPDVFQGARTLEQIDQIDAAMQLGLPSHWTKAVRYLYSEGYAQFWEDRTPELLQQELDYIIQFAPSLNEPYPLSTGAGTYSFTEEPRLLKATTVTKRDGADPNPTSSATLYRYSTGRYIALDEFGSTRYPTARLSAIFRPSTVSTIVSRLRAGQFISGSTPGPNDVVRLTNDAVIGPSGNAQLEPTLLELADLRCRDFGDRSFVPDSQFAADYRAGSSEFVRSDVLQSLVADIARPPNTILWDPFGVHVLHQKDSSEDQGVYRIFRFMLFDLANPPQLTGDPPPLHPRCHTYDFPSGNWMSELIYGFWRSRFDQPYNIMYNSNLQEYGPIVVRSVPGTEPMWVTVIDRLRREQDADYWKYSSQASGYPYPATRRIVMMNKAGYVLRDKTITYTISGSGAVTQSTGVAEEYYYDDFGRMTEKRSKGWSTLPVGSNTDAGLIHVYQYADPPNPTPATAAKVPSREGIKKGLNGTVHWLVARETHPQRRDLTTKVVSFNTPTTDPTNEAGATVDRTFYLLEPVPNGPPSGDTRVKRKVEVGAAHAQAPGGTPYYPVRKEWYDDGKLTWKAHGSVADRMSPSEDNPSPIAPGDTLFLDYSEYDTQGRLKTSVVDAVPGSSGVPTGPAGFTAAPAGRYALQYKTEYTYCEYGPTSIKFPDNRTHYFFYKPTTEEGASLEQRVYEDVVQFGSTFRAHAPAKSMLLDAGGRTLKVRKGAIAFGGAPSGNETLDVKSTLDLGYGAGDQVTSAQVTGQGGVNESAYLEYNDFGGIRREQNPAGTVTRYANDQLGRVERVYRGTSDKNPYWGTLPPGSQPIDNMALIEYRRYGESVSDAHELVEVRKYQRGPVGAYPPASLTVEDDLSTCRAEMYLYDWRMRPVVTRWPSRTGTAGTYDMDVTWLDQQGRTRHRGRYIGISALPASVDPSLASRGPSSDVPSATTIVSASPTPVEFTETVYNLAGQAEEQREYNMQPGSSYGTYLVRRSYFDHRSLQVYSDAPGGGTTITANDALGRAMDSRLLAGGVEVQRTERVFDTRGREIETRVYERRHNAAASGLIDGTNSVRRRMWRWFDESNRVVAEADLGSDNPAETYVTGAQPSVYAASDPRIMTSDILVGVDRSSMGPMAMVTCYQHDDQGRVIRTLHPNGSIEQSFYDSVGRISKKIENAAASNPTVQTRATGYAYANGQLAMIGAINDAVNDGDWTTVPTLAQVTRVNYAGVGTPSVGVPIVDASPDNLTQTVVSQSYDVLGRVHYPDPVNGLPASTADFTFGYYRDGNIAWRCDRRGIFFRYFYDGSGNLVRILVDDAAFIVALPAGSELPPDLIRRIDFSYDGQSRVAVATAWATTAVTTSQNPIADVQMTYGALGVMTAERQSHGELAHALSPQVSYAWTYLASGAGNTHRLQSMTYPRRSQTNQGRVITLGYGATSSTLTSPGSADSALDRVTSISDNTLGVIAGYVYAGSGRRVGCFWGGDALSTSVAGKQTGWSPTGTYDRLDRFGRWKDQVIEKATGSIIHRYQYARDAAGQITAVRATQATLPQPHDNDRSSLFAYDGLGRLKQTTVGVLNPTNTAITSAMRDTTWSLDRQGNWSETLGQMVPGRSVVGIFPGIPGTSQQQTTHVRDNRNQISQVSATLNGVPQNRVITHDAAGNIVCDGDYIYQYDAWSRLIQVRAKGTVTAFDPVSGFPSVGQPGAWIAQYTYDPFGRLVRKLSPWTTANKQRVEHYYYDGARRIQDVFVDPFENTDESPVAAKDEKDTPPVPTTVTWTHREYVYGPGDLDDFVCQINSDNLPLYMISDASFNIVGVFTPAGDVAEQLSYDSYGEVLSAERSATPSGNRIGYKGLWYDRFDVNLTMPVFAPEAKGLYQNRNRSYAPALGRFAQRDPHSSGQALLIGTRWFAGRGAPARILEFDMQRQYGDGMNLNEFAGGEPVRRRDSLGLLLAIELGESGGARGMLNSFLGPPAVRASASLGALATSGGIWAVNFAASGALVVGYNADTLMMLASHVDANWDVYFDSSSNDGSGYNPSNEPGMNDKFTPKGRELPDHARKMMRQRGITGKDVDRVLDTTKGVPQTNNYINHYSRQLDITVIYNPANKQIVTIIDGFSRPR